MNVLEAAREVQKDRTKVFKGRSGTIKSCPVRNGIVLDLSHGCSYLHISEDLIDSYDDFQPVLDPTKLKVDDPIEVRGNDNFKWEHRHFAKYEDGRVFAWDFGKTSWTSYDGSTCPWNYWRLPESK